MNTLEANPPSSAVSGTTLARVALALPFAGSFLFWLQFGNPFAMQSSDWGRLFYLCLFMGGAGVLGAVLSCVALKRGVKGLAVVALILNGLAVLCSLGTLLG